MNRYTITMLRELVPRERPACTEVAPPDPARARGRLHRPLVQVARDLPEALVQGAEGACGQYRLLAGTRAHVPARL